MRRIVAISIGVATGSLLAGCHHRQSDPVYTTPATETVVTTTTVTTTDSTTSGSSSSSSSLASTASRGRGTGQGRGQGEARSERREVHLAIGSLERARREMERAGHEFGGRKGDALKATDAALRELRLASGQEAREARTGTETAAERRAEGRELHLALADLERSRADMERATHDFSGRRKETLEAVDAAIREIRRAIEYER